MKKTATPDFLDDASASALPKMNTKKNSPKEAQYTVVKRNGTLVPFKRERILQVIEAAFRDTKQVPSPAPLDEELKVIIEQMTAKVVTQVLNLATKGACLTVEGIQDVVEVTLMKNGHHDVARDYIIYRDERKAERQLSLQNLKSSNQNKRTSK